MQRAAGDYRHHYWHPTAPGHLHNKYMQMPILRYSLKPHTLILSMSIVIGTVSPAPAPINISPFKYGFGST